jgi:hypothetical protein
MTRVLFITLLALTLSLTVFAGDLDDVHLFQNFLRDATITSNPYAEGYLNYNSYDYVNITDLAVRGGYGVNSNLELNANIGFRSFNPENGDGESGLTDLGISGRYLVHSQDGLRVTAGGLVTLPIGSEDIGQSNLNFGAFGAARYDLANGMVITGTLGLDFYETVDIEVKGGGVEFIDGQLIYTEPEIKETTKYENSLLLGAGVIYPYSDVLAIVGEFVLKSNIDYTMLSGGVDYTLNNGARVRGALGLGLDDGAPDVMLLVSYLMSF